VNLRRRLLGINAQTIYFYERINLIPKLERMESGYRCFSEQDIERLAFILRLRALGLDLNEIREIISLQAKQTIPCQNIHALLLVKMQQIEKTIVQLQSLKSQLLPFIETCEANLLKQGKFSNCSTFIEENYET